MSDTVEETEQERRLLLVGGDDHILKSYLQMVGTVDYNTLIGACEQSNQRILWLSPSDTFPERQDYKPKVNQTKTISSVCFYHLVDGMGRVQTRQKDKTWPADRPLSDTIDQWRVLTWKSCPLMLPPHAWITCWCNCDKDPPFSYLEYKLRYHAISY